MANNLSQYTKIGGAYFQQSPGGLSAVSDPGILNQLKSGAISAQEQGVGAIAGPNLTPVTPYAAPSLPPKITSEVLNPAPLPPISTPTAPTQQAAYFDSVTQQAESAKKSLEEERKRQLEDTQRQRQESEKKQTELAARQAEILGEVKGITTPFREDLETKERERLYINENFEANQKLTRELDSLLSEGNALIEQERSRPVATAIQSRLVSQTMEKVAARAGVIQAVMAARSGQIGEAERLIDRSVNAINADRNDQLTYYNALMSFYETAKTDEGKKITELTKEEKSFFQSTIKDLESEVKRTQDYADMIKKAMADPDKAQAYGQAGVTLMDSPEEINGKLSSYAFKKEVADKSNEMSKAGYTYLLPGQAAPFGSEVVTTIDSKGVSKKYYKAGKEGGVAPSSTDTTTETLTNKINLIDDLISHPGLDSRVGPTFIARRGFAALDAFGAGQDFAAGVTQLVNKETIDTLVNLKARGGTLGALSDQERILLQSAATKIGFWEVKDSVTNAGTGEYEIDEASFKRELETIRTFAKKAITRHLGYDPTLVHEDDVFEIDTIYEEARTSTLEFDPSTFY